MQVAFGSGLLFATPLYDALGAAIANPTPFLLGVMQDCGIDLSAETKELHGQSQYPVDIARGKGKLACKAKSAQINARQLNSLFFGQTLATGQSLVRFDTVGTAIPTTPFQITPTVPGGGTFAANLGVRTAAGIPFVRVASAPATGQYSLSGGQYTFAAADVGTVVYIDFRYTITGGFSVTMTNLPMGEIPTFTGELWLQKNGKGTYVRIPNMVCGKLGLQTKQDDYLIPDFDFSGFADSLGNVVYWSSAE